MTTKNAYNAPYNSYFAPFSRAVRSHGSFCPAVCCCPVCVSFSRVRPAPPRALPCLHKQRGEEMRRDEIKREGSIAKELQEKVFSRDRKELMKSETATRILLANKGMQPSNRRISAKTAQSCATKSIKKAKICSQSYLWRAFSCCETLSDCWPVEPRLFLHAVLVRTNPMRF